MSLFFFSSFFLALACMRWLRVSFLCLKLDEKYETVACGKTPDQLEMTELAKQCAMTFKPRSLVLWEWPSHWAGWREQSCWKERLDVLSKHCSTIISETCLPRPLWWLMCSSKTNEPPRPSSEDSESTWPLNWPAAEGRVWPSTCRWWQNNNKKQKHLHQKLWSSWWYRLQTLAGWSLWTSWTFQEKSIADWLWLLCVKQNRIVPRVLIGQTAKQFSCGSWFINVAQSTGGWLSHDKQCNNDCPTHVV